jgi:hypothetical protein
VQVNYTTSYNLTTLEDGQVYLVLKDYHMILVPQNVKVYLDNLFNGNKVLGEWRSSVVPTGASEPSTDLTAFSLFQAR